MPLLNNLSPSKQLLALLLIVLASLFIFVPFGLLVAVPFVEGDLFMLLNSIDLAESESNINLLKYLQIISQIGLFILSSFLFAFLVSGKMFSYFGLNFSPKATLIVLSVIISIVSIPLINWIMEMNYQMHLPESLSSVENWMRQMESEAAYLTELFLNSNTFSSFLVNLLMMALLAGLGEELLLRGILQPLFIRITSNAHAGIWIAAALFSIIHFQFFGFFPRLIMGALFGYYFYWTRNLWIPIIAHVFNNGLIVTYVYITGSSDIIPKLNESETVEETTGWMLILSVLLTVAGLIIFYKESLKETK